MTPFPRPYSSAAAFRRALEDRLKARSSERGEDLTRLRRLVAFDRFLGRLFTDEQTLLCVLKGGFGLEIRYRMDARTTKDIDLSFPDTTQLPPNPRGLIAAVLEMLQGAAARNVGDYFVIRVGEARQDFNAPPEGGARFPVEVRLDGRRFTSFHVDVGLGDPIIEAPEWHTGEDLLGFAGLRPARIPLIPVTQQIAEKFHVYTLARGASSNSRVKDLVDLVLLLEQESPEPHVVQQATIATFTRRATHRPPAEFPRAPGGWARSYEAMAREAGARRKAIHDAQRFVADFWRLLEL